MLPKVRYVVRQRCFVNGCLYDPSADPKRPTYIVAAAGLEGGALELAPEGKAPPGAAPNPHEVERPTSSRPARVSAQPKRPGPGAVSAPEGPQE